MSKQDDTKFIKKLFNCYFDDNMNIKKEEIYWNQIIKK